MPAQEAFLCSGAIVQNPSTCDDPLCGGSQLSCDACLDRVGLCCYDRELDQCALREEGAVGTKRCMLECHHRQSDRPLWIVAVVLVVAFVAAASVAAAGYAWYHYYWRKREYYEVLK